MSVKFFKGVKLKSQIEDLYRRTGFTKESCFHASRRMKKHDNLSLMAMTTLSFGLIIVSMMSQVYEDNVFIVRHNRFIGFSITSMSVFALAFSVLVHKSGFGVRAEGYRKQAMAISDLRISFRPLLENESGDGRSREEIYSEKSEGYAKILNGNIVHDQIDYLVSSTQGVEKRYYSLKLFLSEFFWYWMVFILIFLLVVWVFSGVYHEEMSR